jgi:predicted metalloprotease with PDZ domain
MTRPSGCVTEPKILLSTTAIPLKGALIFQREQGYQNSDRCCLTTKDAKNTKRDSDLKKTENQPPSNAATSLSRFVRERRWEGRDVSSL